MVDNPKLYSSIIQNGECLQYSSPCHSLCESLHSRQFPCLLCLCLLSKVGVHRSAFLRRRSEPCSSSLCQHPTLGVRFSCPVPIGKTYPFFSSGQRRPWSPGNEVLAHVPPPASFLPCSRCFLAQLRVPSCLWPDLVRNGEMPSGEGCCTWRWTSSLQGGRCRGTI